MATAWGEPQLWGSQGAVWREILNKVRDDVEPFLEAKGIRYDVTEFRWDVPDLTFCWPQRITVEKAEIQYFNIHCWVEGLWPSYSLNIEAATWRDLKSERNVLFIPSISLQVTVEGTPERPSVQVEGLTGAVRAVVDSVEGADLKRGQVYPLEAETSSGT